jgi:septum formation topological specificity factor MinE
MKKIVFVSDMFAQDYRGGAELTTEAFMTSNPWGSLVSRIHCQRLNVEALEQSDKDVHFIVCNFASLDDKVKIHMCKNSNYSILEYDYKLCKYRSMKKHETQENKPCDCSEQVHGRINSAFYGYAKRVWFMSQGQKEIFLSKIKVLKEENCEVVSSAFSEGDLRFMQSIKNNEKDNKYLILGSNSWIKGTEECIKYAKDNNLEFEVISGLPYHELLIKMSTSKGLIFQPLDHDTCPRLVIEAKLLGCDLILNEHVQHKDEEWFATADKCYQYLKERPSVFWSYYEQ